MEYLVLDTETSGLFDFSKPADAAGQPRLAAVTMLLTDDDMLAGSEPDFSREWSNLIQPNGWEITPEITAINGLTTERCAAVGVPVGEALDFYQAQIEDGRIVVAYNAQFDTKVMRGEFRLAGREDLFERTPNICTMRCLTKFGIQKEGGGKGFPKLTDAYRHFSGRPMDGAHTSLVDAKACLVVMHGLMRAGALVPKVHYAKNPPQRDTAA